MEVLIGLMMFILKTLLGFVLWVISWSYPIIIMGMTVTIPLYFLNRYGKSMNPCPVDASYRLRPQRPSFYINSFGHLRRVDPDPDNEESIRDYLQEYDLTEIDLNS